MKKHFPHSDYLKDTYYRKEAFRQKLLEAKKHGPRVFANTVRKLNNCQQARLERGQVRIIDIFNHGWESFRRKHADRLTRPSVVTNVEKAMRCGTLEAGYMVAECPHCDNIEIIKFTCKSRFCPSCGKKYRDIIAVSVQRKLYDVPHRQFVFSVPEDLRTMFRAHRGMLDVLFSAVSDTLTEAIFGKAPIATEREHRQLGFISFLHTFGRDLKWHPHLHVLVAESYSTGDGRLHHISFFPFEAMRFRFMYSLLSGMSEWLRENSPWELPAFRKAERRMKAKYVNGFYVYGPRMQCHRLKDFAALAKYVARYASHPPISEGRIDRFDPGNDTVTWHYDPHEDDTCEECDRKGRQYVTDSVDRFIARLIVHIPDDRFQQIRYYGFYSNRGKTRPHHRRMSTDEENREVLEFLRWERMLMSMYGYSPMICDCGARMHINHQLSYFPGMNFEEWKKRDSS